MTWSERVRAPLLRAAYWITPSILLLVIYRLSTRVWFQQDDFAWLGLDLGVYDWPSLWHTLTAPMAQGTLRILSERVLFMSSYKLFGLNHVPFRIVVFATQIGNLLLVSAITRRITGSALAGFAAPILWLVNSNLVVALSWTSAYNQILCAFFLLLALYCLIRFDETGRNRWNLGHWAAFLIGFLALELNVVYPALALGFVLLVSPWERRRRLLLAGVGPMSLVSAGYAVLHRMAGGEAATGVYQLHWDLSVFGTLLTYWRWVLGPERYAITHHLDPRLVLGATWFLSLVLLGFVSASLLRRRWVVLFGPWWFLVVLAPLLPLRDHLSEYYLTIPSIGLAMLGAQGLASVLPVTRPREFAAAGLALLTAVIYCSSSVPISRSSAQWYFERGRDVKKLVLGVAQASRLHPGKAILLTGVGDTLFWAGVFDRPFRLVGALDVYLAPGAEESIHPHPEAGEVRDYVLPALIAKKLLDREQAVVYDVSGPRLRNITSRVRDLDSTGWRLEPVRRVDIGSPWYSGQLGPAWHREEGGYRWMPKSATVRVGGPAAGDQRLYLMAYCPAEQLTAGPLTLEVAVDGIPVGKTAIQKPAEVDAVFSLPAELAGREWVEVKLSVDRTYRGPSDERELGLAFGTVSIR